MDYTANYHLPQWVKEDRILMEDFNEAMSSIDQGIKGVDTTVTEGLAAVAANLGAAGKNARIAWGSYVGTGKYGAGNPTSLSFDFYPVVVFCGCELWASEVGWPSIYIRDCPKAHCDSMSFAMNVTWQDKGISWYSNEHQGYQNNSENERYYYVAIGYDKDAEA